MLTKSLQPPVKNRLGWLSIECQDIRVGESCGRLSLFSPPTQVKTSWTRPGSNRYLHHDRGLCCQLHHRHAALYLPYIYNNCIVLYCANLPPPGRFGSCFLRRVVAQEQIAERNQKNCAAQLVGEIEASSRSHDDGIHSGYAQPSAGRNKAPILHGNPHFVSTDQAATPTTAASNCLKISGG